MNYEPEDLVKLWKLQDDVNAHSHNMIAQGIRLGVLSVRVEMSKLLLQKFNQPLTQNDIDEAAAIAQDFALTELEKGMKNARGS